MPLSYKYNFNFPILLILKISNNKTTPKKCIYIIKIVNHSYIRTCAIKKSRTKSYNKHSISFIVLVSHVKSYRRQERQYKGIVMVCQNKPFLHQYHLILEMYRKNVLSIKIMINSVHKSCLSRLISKLNHIFQIFLYKSP